MIEMKYGSGKSHLLQTRKSIDEHKYSKSKQKIEGTSQLTKCSSHLRGNAPAKGEIVANWTSMRGETNDSGKQAPAWTLDGRNRTYRPTATGEEGDRWSPQFR